MSGKPINEIGNIHGRLTVVSLSDQKEKNGGVKWICLCECGKKTHVTGSKLRKGHTTSCGCFGHEQRIKSRMTHGESNSLEMKSWKSMLARCYNPSANGYKNYGGKGIVVCDRWRESIENFIEDMGRRPSIKYTLDRIDSSKGYCKENCRWATPAVQQRNKSSTKLTESIVATCREKYKNGVSVRSLSKKYAIAAPTLYDAIRRLTWN